MIESSDRNAYDNRDFRAIWKGFKNNTIEPGHNVTDGDLAPSFYR